MSANKHPQKNKSRKFIIIATIAIIIIAGAIITWQFYKYKLVDKKIQSLVTTKSKGLYNINYSNITVDEIGGTLKMTDVKIDHDTAIWNQLKKTNEEPSTLLKVSIPFLNVSGVKTPKALLNKEIVGDKIEITNATIEIQMADNSKKDEVKKTNKALYEQLLGELKMIKVNQVDISNATLIITDYKTKAPRFKGSNLSFNLQDLLIDSLSSLDSTRILYAKDLTASCEEASIESKDKKYAFRFGKIALDSKNNLITIGKASIDPTYNETEFLRISKWQTDRYDFNLENIRLVNTPVRSLFKNKLFADSLVIGKSSFKVYRDLSYPRDPKVVLTSFPQQQLLDMPIALNIRQVVIRNSFIEYKEKNPISNNSGKVQFHNVSATMNNVTNLPAAISANKIWTVNFNCSFLNKAPVKARLKLYLDDPRSKFAIDGSMGSMNAEDLNALSVPMGMLRVNRGFINGVNFNFQGNAHTCGGSFKLLYKDLKVSLLEKEGKKYDKKDVSSLVANAVIKNDNPKHGDVRIASPNYPRDNNRSFFNLLWKTMFVGIKETAGM